MNLSGIILAAGQGTRMKSKLPKGAAQHLRAAYSYACKPGLFRTRALRVLL